MMRSFLTSTVWLNGRFTIPAQIRIKLGLKPGDKVDFLLNDNQIILKRAFSSK